MILYTYLSCSTHSKQSLSRQCCCRPGAAVAPVRLQASSPPRCRSWRRCCASRPPGGSAGGRWCWPAGRSSCLARSPWTGCTPASSADPWGAPSPTCASVSEKELHLGDLEGESWERGGCFTKKASLREAMGMPQARLDVSHPVSRLLLTKVLMGFRQAGARVERGLASHVASPETACGSLKWIKMAILIHFLRRIEAIQGFFSIRNHAKRSRRCTSLSSRSGSPAGRNGCSGRSLCRTCGRSSGTLTCGASSMCTCSIPFI